MLFNEFTIPFMVMATMLQYANSQTNEIPMCEPPALICPIFKRSVCEWSDAGEPVWACRGYIETFNSGLKRLLPKSAEGANAAQQDSEYDVTFGTYEYQIPQGSSKVEAKHDSSESDVQFATYSYPIITKSRKNGASQLGSKSEVEVALQKTAVSSSGKSSSVSKTESGSEVNIGTYSFPGTGSRNGEDGEFNSNIQLGTYTYKSPSVIKSSVSNVETGPDVQIGTYTLAQSSGKGTDVANDDSHSDAHIQTHIIQVPTIKKSSVSKVRSDSTVQIGTYTLPVPGGKTDEVADTESESNVQIGTLYQIPSSKTTTSRVESVSGNRIGEAAPVESDYDVLYGTYTHQFDSDKNISGTQTESQSNLLLQTYANAISSQNSSDIVDSDSESNAQTVTFSISSGKSSKLSNSDSKSNVQFGTHQVASSSRKNIVVAPDDFESKRYAAAYTNQSSMKSSDSQASAVKTGTASSMNSDTDSHIGIHAHQVSSVQSSSQSQDQLGSNAYSASSFRNIDLESGSQVNAKLDSGISSSSFSNIGSEAKSGIGSVVYSVGNNKMLEEYVPLNGLQSTIQGSLMSDARYLSSSRAATLQGSQTNGWGLINSGGGQYTSLSGLDTNLGINQQNMPGYSTAFNTQQYDSLLNGNAGSVQTAGTFGQTSNSQYIGGERKIGGDYRYSGGSYGSHTLSEHQTSSVSSTVSPYHLNSGNYGNSAGQYYLQYQSNPTAGSDGAHQKYGTGTQNKLPFSYPYYGYGGYKSLEQRSSSGSSSHSASSENSVYHWPQTWSPLVNIGGAGYGTHLLVGHNTPLLENPGLNSLVAPQSTVPLANSGFYGSRSLNSGSANSASPTSISSYSNPWYILPLSQYVTSRALGTSSIDQYSCSFCKKLMQVFDGAEVCDALEPIILEFFNKVLEIFRKRLKQ